MPEKDKKEEETTRSGRGNKEGHFGALKEGWSALETQSLESWQKNTETQKENCFCVCVLGGVYRLAQRRENIKGTRGSPSAKCPCKKGLVFGWKRGWSYTKKRATWVGLQRAKTKPPSRGEAKTHLSTWHTKISHLKRGPNVCEEKDEGTTREGRHSHDAWGGHLWWYHVRVEEKREREKWFDLIWY